MLNKTHIFLTAEFLIKEHGGRAEAIAESRMQELMAHDDAKRASVWLSIVSAIEDLRNKQKQGTLH